MVELLILAKMGGGMSVLEMRSYHSVRVKHRPITNTKTLQLKASLSAMVCFVTLPPAYRVTELKLPTISYC